MLRRVVVVASTFPATPEDRVPAFVRDQVVAMARVDPELEVTVLAPHDARLAMRDRTVHPEFTEHRFHYAFPRRLERLTAEGIMPGLRARPWMWLLLPGLFVAEAVALWRLVRATRPDVIYAHWFTPQGITGAWVARLTRTRLVLTTHASDVSVWRKVPWLGGVVVRRHLRAVDRATAVSTRSLAKMRGFFSDAQWREVAPRVALLPMGVHLTAPDDGAAGAGDGSRTFLFLGRLAEKKGVHVLLPAFASVADRLPGWRLVVVGDGPWGPRLREQAERLGLGDRVEFTGYVTGEAKDRLLREATVHVTPSVVAEDGDAEGLPVSLLEGLAWGRLCVATHESGADDVLTDGVDGFLVPQRDESALADALVRAATLGEDDAAAVRAAARRTAESFAWDRIARRHLEILFPEESP